MYFKASWKKPHPEAAVVVAEAEFVDQAAGELVGLAADEVLPEVLEVAVITIVAAVEDGTERRGMERRIVEIAKAGKGLVVLADVPVHARVPLPGVVCDLPLDGVVRVGLSAIDVGQPLKALFPWASGRFMG
jgi:hypothetical protein